LRRRTTRFKIEIEGLQQPYEISPRHALASGLRKACRRHGISPRVKGSEGATVITFFQEQKIPAVAFGFGSAGCAHSADEYAKISRLVSGARVLEEFLRNENERGS
jgi:acetylornithine deacetylase/succinyl-diaminopimelate desuccinylase-like protein